MDYKILHYMLDVPFEILEDQIEDIGKMFERKKLILNHETGTGKTMLALGVISLLLHRARMEQKKIIVTAPSNKMEGFKQDIKNSIPAARVLSITGQAPDVRYILNNIDNYDVIVTMPSLWSSFAWCKYVYENTNKFICSIYDEAAGIRDDAYRIFCEFSKQQFEYSFLLNATPVKRSTELEKTYNLLYAVGAIDSTYTFRNFEKDMITLPVNIGNKRSKDLHGVVDEDKFRRMFGDYIINRSKSDLGVEVQMDVNFHRCKMSKEQEEAIEDKNRKANSRKTYLGKLDNNTEILYNPVDLYPINPMTMEALGKSLQTVMYELNKETTNNIVVFMQNTDIKYRFKSILDSMGIKNYVMDGSLNPAQKNATENEYNQSEKTVMITNLEKASSFQSANVMIIYGFPEDIIQTTNRIVRGRGDKKVTIHWIYYAFDSYSKLYKQLELSMEDERISQREFMCTIPLYKELSTYFNEPSMAKFHAILKERSDNEHYTKR